MRWDLSTYASLPSLPYFSDQWLSTSSYSLFCITSSLQLLCCKLHLGTIRQWDLKQNIMGIH